MHTCRDPELLQYIQAQWHLILHVVLFVALGYNEHCLAATLSCSCELQHKLELSDVLSTVTRVRIIQRVWEERISSVCWSFFFLFINIFLKLYQYGRDRIVEIILEVQQRQVKTTKLIQ